MKRAAVLIAILSGVAAAGAYEIQLFWSTTGISDPNLMYSTALTNFQPAYQPPTPVSEMVGGTYDLFLWGTFPFVYIRGLDLKWGPGNTAPHAQNVAYRHKWGNTSPAKRWDGSAGILLDGVMAAVTASGISWPPYRLMEPQGSFLIGAARITGAAGQHAIISLDGPTRGLGIANPRYEQVTPDVLPADLVFVAGPVTGLPEPSAVVLLIAALLLRRR